MQEDPERLAWLRLGLAPELPADLAVRLVEACGSPTGAAGARRGRLALLLGSERGGQVARALRRSRPERVLRAATDLGQAVLTPADAAYPHAALEGLHDPPPVLFLRGRLPHAERPAVAVVGTRDASPYGLEVARALAEDLAAAGLWVVSGLALGVDGAAHEGALEAGGPTLAVLGCGLDVAYPAAHADLKERIAKSGGLLSEHAPGVEPRRWHFPQRNRLVAALAQAVVVVEAPARSGALITARLALDLGREVLAVPGSVRRAQQAGCHRLLKQGAAALCESAADVLAHLGLEGEARKRSAGRGPPGEGTEAVLWRLLDEEEAQDASAICRRCGLTATDVAAALASLEIDGRVKRIPGVGFVRT